jgi:hypothetical protein
LLPVKTPRHRRGDASLCELLKFAHTNDQAKVPVKTLAAGMKEPCYRSALGKTTEATKSKK